MVYQRDGNFPSSSVLELANFFRGVWFRVDPSMGGGCISFFPLVSIHHTRYWRWNTK